MTVLGTSLGRRPQTRAGVEARRASCRSLLTLAALTHPPSRLATDARACRRRALSPHRCCLSARPRAMAEPAPATLMPLADLRFPDDLGEKVRVAGL